MVLYLDLAFILNSLADGLALYVTARLAGCPVRRKRLWLASAIGGVYGTLCLLPPLGAMGSFLPQAAVAALLVWLMFGAYPTFLRLFLLFFVLSCALGGVMLAMTQYITAYGISDTLHIINWKVFFLAGGLCYFLLSVVFRGDVRHAVERQLFQGTLLRNGKTTQLTVLRDTGHTLSQPGTGKPVMTVWVHAVETLFETAEWEVLSRLEEQGAVWCMEQLAEISAGGFQLIPYRAVGVSEGMLLAFCADTLTLGENVLEMSPVALSPTPVSDGGGYHALWGDVCALQK